MQTVNTGGLVFLCDDAYEVARAQTLYTKEPGTIAWLRETLKPGDVFYDIGANIGCYSLVAAQLVGPTGHVYAFEPHVFNAASLLRNVQANDIADVVTVVPIALGACYGVRPFQYHSTRPGSSGHQLDYAITERGVAFTPPVSVLTPAFILREVDGLRAPHVVKIDVDGQEHAILRGMQFGAWLRSVQVESHPARRADITAFMVNEGYGLVGRHYTKSGEKAIKAGAHPDAVVDNAIFERVAVLA